MLPFKPTEAQKRVIKEIADDMREPRPMNRLLQGDVGSGKTIVAAEAAVIAIENGYQVARARADRDPGHAARLYFSNILNKLGYVTALLTGSFTSREKTQLKKLVAEGLVACGGRHARASRKGRRVQEPGAGDRRRAAPLRRDAAARAGAEGRASRRARDDGDADSAHARADALRRPGRLGDRRAAARPQADPDEALHGGPHRAGVQLHEEADRRGPAGVRGVPGDRGIGNAGDEGGAADVRAPFAGGFPGCRGRTDARAAGIGREGSGDAALQGRADARSWFRLP